MANRFVLYLVLGFSFCAAISIAQNEEKVSVALYYESLCPACHAFILEQLAPNYPTFASRMELALVPYGNAKTTIIAGKPRFTCQHGKEECKGNIIQACVIKILNSSQTSLNFISCAINQVSQESSIEQCLSSTDVQNEVRQCADGDMGTNLEYEMGNITNSLKPPHKFTPWITFNGEGGVYVSEQASEDFVKTLCSYYKDDLPKQCQ